MFELNDDDFNGSESKRSSEDVPLYADWYGPFAVYNHRVYYIDGKKENPKPEKVSKYMKIESVKRYLETGEVKLSLAYWYQGKIHTMDISRSQLTTFEIQKLLKYGLDVFDHNARRVVKYLSIQEDFAPQELYHSHLGWAIHEEEAIYKHKGIAGTKKMSSTYDGPFTLEAKGTFQEWKRLIQEEVMGVPTLELALTMGFSSVLVGFLHLHRDVDSLIFHLWGGSTKGKTTAAKLALSPFGKPTSGHGGLVNTWNGTTNSLISLLKNNHGVPFVIDEASVSNMKDFTKMIYQLASGREKTRLTKEADLREIETWATTVITTAEKSLMSNSMQNVGQLMRLFEFSDIFWTESADNADRLKEGISDHYGHAGPMFAEGVAAMDTENLMEQWKAWSKSFYESLEESQGVDRFTTRIADKMAIVLLTAEIMQETFDMTMDMEGMKGLLLDQTAETAGLRDIAENAMEVMIGQVLENANKFDSDFQNPNLGLPSGSYEYWGKKKYKGTYVEVYILPHKFREILRENGFEDERVVLASWKEKGYLVHDKGKYQKKTTVHNISDEHKQKDNRANTICFRVPATSLKVGPAPEARKRPSTEVRKSQRKVTTNNDSKELQDD